MVLSKTKPAASSVSDAGKYTETERRLRKLSPVIENVQKRIMTNGQKENRSNGLQ